MLALLLALLTLSGPQARTPADDIRAAVAVDPASRALVMDLDRLRRAGFNAVAARREAGLIAFTRTAASAGLGVIPRERPIAVRSGPRAVAEARLAFWKALGTGSRDIVFEAGGAAVTQEVLALGETVGVVTRNQELFRGLQPRAAAVQSVSTGAMGPVQVRLLESPEIIVILALCHAATPTHATITFGPDVPEAIWQSLVTGTSINFVMGPTGPVLDYRFAPHEALVLSIRKRFR